MFVFILLVTVLLHPSLQKEKEADGFSYKSSFGVELLMRSEQLLVEEMEAAIRRFENTTNVLTEALNRYVGRYRDIQSIITNISEISAHPINSYHFMKDVVLDWLVITNVYSDEESQKYVEILDELKEIRRKSEYPALNDLSSIAMTICSMQRVYDLQLDDIVEGNIVDQRTNKVYRSLEKLGSWDCVVFGRASLAEGWYNTAVDWMQAAKRLSEEGDGSLEKDIIDKFLREAIQKHDTYLMLYGPYGESWETHPYPIDRDAMKTRSDQFKTTLPEFQPRLYSTMTMKKLQENRKRLCQGQQLREPSLSDGLVCRYLTNNNPYLFIGPFKVEEVSNDPAVTIYHDFISESETEKLKNLAGHNLADSVYTFTDKNLTTKGLQRISRESLLFEKADPALIPRLSHRVQVATKLDTRSRGKYIYFKVINYGIAGHYETHRDYYQDPNVDNRSNRLLKPDGDRIATLLMYINKVEAGGATVFPPIGVTTWPKYRSAVFWYNLHKNGLPDSFTYHSGCPVLYGAKWVANHWPLIDNQMFTSPCGLHEWEKHGFL